MNNIPQKVKWGLGFFGASTVLQLIGLFRILTMYLPPGYRETSQVYSTAVSTLSISIIISIMLLVFMFMRHNWARIVYTILFGIGLIFLLVNSKYPNMVMMLDAVGLIFLYTKDSTMWFKTEPNEQ
jgi:hypothetical protein